MTKMGMLGLELQVEFRLASSRAVVFDEDGSCGPRQRQVRTARGLDDSSLSLGYWCDRPVVRDSHIPLASSETHEQNEGGRQAHQLHATAVNVFSTNEPEPPGVTGRQVRVVHGSTPPTRGSEMVKVTVLAVAS